MQHSNIEWTDFTSNPLQYRNAAGQVVWACIHKSPGCKKCYAEKIALRYRRGLAFTAENMKLLTPFLNDKELQHMRTYKPAAGRRCFVGDMTDIFGEWVSDDLLNQLFTNTLEMRENVTWQLLTKRADRMRDYLSWRWGEGRIPMRNIHIGVSCEDQKTADERIPKLLQTPAAVRFVSYEPALGPVNFRGVLMGGTDPGRCGNCGKGHGFTRCPNYGGISRERTESGCNDFKRVNFALDWIIVGGESGPGARPFNIQWARDVVAQCKAAGVACFVKQLGSKIRPPGSFDDFFTAEDMSIVGKWRLHAKEGPDDCAYMMTEDRKGGDPAEWPESLRVREFPVIKSTSKETVCG